MVVEEEEESLYLREGPTNDSHTRSCRNGLGMVMRLPACFWLARTKRNTHSNPRAWMTRGWGREAPIELMFSGEYISSLGFLLPHWRRIKHFGAPSRSECLCASITVKSSFV